MEYLVLARKWRPQSFAEVVGQEQVTKTLSNAIVQNRIAHAFIFSGPRGVGKTSIARILAKALNCEQGPTPAPCQVCGNCREVTAGTSIDVREIDGASNRGIDEIRELRENVKFSPASARYKIYIIDEVHMLTREAFNALLKTLEEPPPHVVFIFATTELQKIPATILSRCQCHDFRMISLRQIAAQLKQIAEAENIRISALALNWIAAAGNGSMRDAQSVFDQIISYAGSDVADAAVEEVLSLTDRRFVYLLSQALRERNTAQCLKIIQEGYYAGLDMKYFYKMLLSHFRDLLFVKLAGEEASLFDLAADDLAKLKVQVAGLSRDTLQRYLDLLMAEEEAMRRTQDPRLLLETTIVRMACLAELIPIDEILGRMENLEKRLQGGKISPRADSGTKDLPSPAPPAAPQPAAVLPEVREKAAPYQAGEAEPGQLWEDYKAFVRKRDSRLCSKIEPGRLLGYGERTLTIGFHKDYIFLDALREKTQQERLAEISRDFFDDTVEVKIAISEAANGDAAGRAQVGAKNNQDARHEALNHPLVQKALDVFEGAEVVEIIPRKIGG